MDSAFPHPEIRLHWGENANENIRVDHFSDARRCRADAAWTGRGATVC
jgi:hypothetical protein